MKNLNLRTISGLLSRSQRRRLYLFASLRLVANGLDLVGLAGIALLAASFGTIASGEANVTPLDLPVLGPVLITELEAVIIAILTCVTFIMKSAFSIWLNLMVALSVAAVEGDFAEALTKNFFSSEPSFAGGISETVSRFQTSILVSTSSVAGYLNARIGALAELTLVTCLGLVFLLVNPLATLGAFVYLGAVIFALNLVIEGRLKSHSKSIVKGAEVSLNSSRELFNVRREVKSSGGIGVWLDRIVDAKRRTAIGKGLVLTLTTLPRFVIETSLILGVFGFLSAVVILSDLSSQAVTIGVFMAGGLRLVASLIPLQNFYNTMVSSVESARLALSTLVEIEKHKPPAHTANINVADLPPALELCFRDVSFEFSVGAPRALSEVSFEVLANSKTAIVGPSGAGKTTTFELATGFRLPSQGSVTLAGYSPRHLLEKTSGVIGIVPQRPHLVTGTLAENVSLESAGSTDTSKVIECLEKAGLEQFIGVDGKGLEMQVTPDSGQLSGGEIQRLGLARALYRDPKILFLDEATSALDAETESKISRVLDSLRSQMTVVLIAHRLSTVMNADKIIYLDKGKVVAQGTFAELKKQVPDFAKAVQLMDLGE